MPGLYLHDNGTHPASDRSHEQRLYLPVRAIEAEVLNHADDAPVLAFEVVDHLAQRFFPPQHLHSSLADDDSSVIGRIVGQGSSLGHAQAHDFDEVAIHAIYSHHYFPGSLWLGDVRHLRKRTRYGLSETHRGDAAVLKQLGLKNLGLVLGHSVVVNDDHLFRIKP